MERMGESLTKAGKLALRRGLEGGIEAGDQALLRGAGSDAGESDRQLADEHDESAQSQFLDAARDHRRAMIRPAAPIEVPPWPTRSSLPR